MLSSDPFSAPTVFRLILSSLPPDETQLKSSHEAIAIFAHACMLVAGFCLTGLSEDDQLQETASGNQDGGDVKPLPKHWNSIPGSYGFRYIHPQSSATAQYMVKVHRLGPRMVISALSLEDEDITQTKNPAGLSLVTKDFISEDCFPYSLAGKEDTDPQNKLKDVFVSGNKIRELMDQFQMEVLKKLVSTCGLGGERVMRDDRHDRHDRHDRQEPPEQLQPNPLLFSRPIVSDRIPPRPIPAGGEPIPGFDDEYDVFRPVGISNPGFPGGRNPLSIGDDDLNPPGLGRFGGGMSGMHPTPDHPMFGGRGGQRRDDTRVPYGARYDPVGPGDEPPTGGLRGPRGPGGGTRGGPGGAPNNPFLGFGSGDFM